jgi:hypothetical protein
MWHSILRHSDECGSGGWDGLVIDRERPESHEDSLVHGAPSNCTSHSLNE